MTIINEELLMSSYCLECKKNIENINPRFSKTNNGRTMLLSESAICGVKSQDF